MQQEGQPATVSVKSSGRQKQRVDHWTEDEEQRRLETYSVRDWAVNRERARMKAGSIHSVDIIFSDCRGSIVAEN